MTDFRYIWEIAPQISRNIVDLVEDFCAGELSRSHFLLELIQMGASPYQATSIVDQITKHMNLETGSLKRAFYKGIGGETLNKRHITGAIMYLKKAADILEGRRAMASMSKRGEGAFPFTKEEMEEIHEKVRNFFEGLTEKQKADVAEAWKEYEKEYEEWRRSRPDTTESEIEIATEVGEWGWGSDRDYYEALREYDLDYGAWKFNEPPRFDDWYYYEYYDPIYDHDEDSGLGPEEFDVDGMRIILKADPDDHRKGNDMTMWYYVGVYLEIDGHTFQIGTLYTTFMYDRGDYETRGPLREVNTTYSSWVYSDVIANWRRS